MRTGVSAPGGARERLAATVAALLRGDSYPGRVRRVEAIETHMSWVFLTEERAYKLKKPLRTALLDHSTVELRRRACITELQLNRRLAEPVYLAVVPVVQSASNAGRLRVEGEGVPIDWLVEMRRLPRDRMLDACIQQGSVEPIELDRLASVLAAFYDRAEPAGFDGPGYRARIASDIEQKGASLAQPRYALEREAIDTVLQAQRGWLATRGHILEERAARVVDAHGDLRPEHVCLDPDPVASEPVAIDCLEFSRELRLLDPLSELSFLALECRRLGASWIGDRLFEAYTERAADAAPRALLHFYESYHALVRAAVAVWHLDDEVLDHSDAWRERGNRYLQIARELLARATALPAR